MTLGDLTQARDRAEQVRAHACLGHRADAEKHLDAAVDGLRRAGRDDYVPLGLLARAAFRRQGYETGHGADYLNRAQQDLDELAELNDRDEMRFFLNDWHLEHARLALAQIHIEGRQDTLIASAGDHTDKAAQLIETTGYRRRDRELEDLRTRLAAL